MHDIYGFSRSREGGGQWLRKETAVHENFILAVVKGDYGAEFLPFYRCALLLEVPQFSARMLPGRDLYERGKAFFDRVISQPESDVENWGCSLNCPVTYADGTETD